MIRIIVTTEDEGIAEKICEELDELRYKDNWDYVVETHNIDQECTLKRFN